jgi:hypothetical protein
LLTRSKSGFKIPFFPLFLRPVNRYIKQQIFCLWLPNFLKKPISIGMS